MNYFGPLSHYRIRGVSNLFYFVLIISLVFLQTNPLPQCNVLNLFLFLGQFKWPLQRRHSVTAIGTVYNNWMSSVDSSWLDSSECRCTANDPLLTMIAVNENKDDRVLKLCV